MSKDLPDMAETGSPDGRRTFLKWSSAGLAGALAYGLTLPQMSLSDAFAQTPGGPTRSSDGTIDVGSGDIGILNFAYALEQLEAAFYIQVIKTRYRGMTSAERQILTDIRDHEIAHRNFFQDALGANAIPALSVDFSAVDFGSRRSVLTTARTFEDLGVSAYNGAGQYLQNPQYLLVAGKIVSVEARHAAAIRDLLRPLTEYFAGDDVVNEQGLDVVREPSEVLPLADPFIATPVSANKLP